MSERNSEVSWRLWGALLITLPIVTFYAILLRNTVDLPETDDYDAILGFLNGFVVAHGFVSRLLFFLSSQHNQYKLLFEHMIVVAEYGLTGHVNLILLQQLGNLTVLLSAGVLWLLFRPSTKSLGVRLVLFAPVVFLLFAIWYGEMLDWAMCALQNFSVIFFALLAIYLLGRGGRRSFAGACVALTGAISASGSGFFLALPGFLFLLQQGRRTRSVAWALLTGALALVYAYHYSLIFESATPQTHPILTIVLFPFVFVGGAAHRIKPALFLVLLIMVAGGYLVAKRWRSLDSPTFFFAIFIVMTALGVTVTRHGFGLGVAISPRYQIYSQLSLAILYMAGLRLRIDRLLPAKRSRLAIGGFGVLTMLFCLASDIQEERFFHHRRELIQDHYAVWVHDPAAVSLVPDEDPAMHSAEMNAFRQRAVVNFERSIALGVYRPPPAGKETQGAGRRSW